MAYKDFTQFSIWQKGYRLVIRVYQITKDLPGEEKFGLISDMRRAANSVIHNVAEGFGRFEKRDKTRFYKITCGSAYELISQSNVCYGLKYITAEKKDELINGFKEVINELDKIIRSVESR